MKRGAALMLALGVSVTGEALAETDFQLEVPVEARQLHRLVDSIRISCRVEDAEERLIGKGEVFRQVTDQAFEATVAVDFNAEPGRDPLAAETYGCELRLRDASGFRYYLPREEDNEDMPIWARPRPESELVAVVEGALEDNGGAEAPAEDAAADEGGGEENGDGAADPEGDGAVED